MRFFNITGPNTAEEHYTIPNAARLPDIARMLHEKSWFVLHAPRQTGKTTILRDLARDLTNQGRYAAVHVSLESASIRANDLFGGGQAILGALRASASNLPPDLKPPEWPAAAEMRAVHEGLRAWASACPRPLVILLDEVDSLSGEVLLSLLRQLREGFPDRPHSFPSTVALCGMRDVRDYKLPESSFGSSSPFNVKVGSFLLRNFNRDEVASLYAQHTAETGQEFPKEVCDRAFELTAGQPWLVNALAREVVGVLAIPPAPIGMAVLEKAKETLIQRRDTHLDSLVGLLKDARVRNILAPMLAGDTLEADFVYDDNLSFLRDLGLVAADDPLRISNPMYSEIIPRVMAGPAIAQMAISRKTPLLPDGRLDLHALLDLFRHFWIEQGPAVARGVSWPEAACQLVLMAFLQHVINGGGSIHREYGFGRGRIDVLISWPAGKQREAIEIKVWRDEDKVANPLPKALVQLDRYLSSLELDHGTVVLFDKRASAGPVEERTRWEKHVSPMGRPVEVLWA